MYDLWQWQAMDEWPLLILCIHGTGSIKYLRRWNQRWRPKKVPTEGGELAAVHLKYLRWCLVATQGHKKKRQRG